MTKMMSAHSTSSSVQGSSASGASPADAVSTPGQSANTRSAVGERRRLREQRKRRLVTQTKKTRHHWQAFHSVDDEGELALAGLKATVKK